MFEKEIAFRAELAPADRNEPFAAEVLVNDRPQPQVSLNAAQDLLTGTIALDPGPNRVKVRLFNPWGTSTAHELQVQFKRPPKIVTFAPPAIVDRAVLDLAAEVDAPPDLKPSDARVNDVPFQGDRFSAKLDPATGHWRVTLHDVVLKEGKNVLRLTVGDADGDSRGDPAEAAVTFTKPPPPRPVVRFSDYKDGEQFPVAQPAVALRFTAVSTDPTIPLKRVELRAGDDPVPLNKALRPGDLQLEDTVQVTLRPATPTTFRLTAINEEGGKARRASRFSCRTCRLTW